MFALVDCNNFFVSCERVFRPDLIGRPVIVLSNNDGCAVALSNEAKALGIKRGDPFFRIRGHRNFREMVVFSGNHRLYGDMSMRVMNILRSLADNVNVYSIDEAFVELPSTGTDYESFGRNIVKRVGRDTGIPVSVGIAPTKTLAKLASRFAKKCKGYHGVCVADTCEKIKKALELTEIGDVWGIGRRNCGKLNRYGVYTAFDFARMPETTVKILFNIVGVRTWRELNGVSCIPDDSCFGGERKTITSSRSFASEIRDKEMLRQAIAGFCSIVGRKLRRQDGFAQEVAVFVCTNRFSEHEPQYCNSASLRLADATNDTAVMVECARRLLDVVYREGYGFKKAGFMVTRIVGRGGVERSLFADADVIDRHDRLFKVLDRLNSSPGNPNCVTLGSMGRGFADMVRSEHSSRLYTTRLSEIITIHT